MVCRNGEGIRYQGTGDAVSKAQATQCPRGAGDTSSELMQPKAIGMLHAACCTRQVVGGRRAAVET
eukprot:28479-Chlamydomonas_euryale.AAC.1